MGDDFLLCRWWAGSVVAKFANLLYHVEQQRSKEHSIHEEDYTHSVAECWDDNQTEQRHTSNLEYRTNHSLKMD